MATEEQVNVLMVSSALQGHINPTLKFAKRLISKGVNVTIVTTEMARDRIYNAPNTTNPHFHNQQIKFEFFSDGLSLDFDRNKDMQGFVDSLRTTASKNLSSLINNLTKGQNYSCMIVDPILPSSINIAADNGIPCALLWMQPCALYSISYRYYRNIDSFPNLDDPNEKVQLPGLPMLEVRDIPTYMLPSSPLFGHQIMMDLCQASDKLKWVFAASFYELEEETVKSMASLTPVYPIGPLVSEFMLGEKENNAVGMSIWNVDDSCLEWLDNKPASSVIYVAFGSIIVLSQKQVDNIAMALKNSNKAFLWVIMPPEKGSENDAPELPHGFLEETKGRGLVVKWCQQEKVLMHPAVACFMSHCGWNSILETLAAGVPVIGYPKWLDQPAIAKLVVKKFQTGVIMNCGEDGVPSAEEMERCIKVVMEGPSAQEIKKRAMEMKEAARKAVEEGGSSDKNINQFVNDLKNVNHPVMA
ncbi:UDP-glycosyltransferase 84B2-like [Gastrolobium bilobum]|uniref:UDP-glycosyltransferase 84B2-like n=1 Tax=Gastrolobium bilobum TaxID=150636 RepID=UPI002AAF4611|nr:UDP-glycosyltransferase 84B2-like [Gastrolobium bilobum]